MSKQFMEFDLADFSNTNKAQKSLAEIRRDSYTEGFIKGKAEGRADAIREFAEYLVIDGYIRYSFEADYLVNQFMKKEQKRDYELARKQLEADAEVEKERVRYNR